MNQSSEGSALQLAFSQTNQIVFGQDFAKLRSIGDSAASFDRDPLVWLIRLRWAAAALLVLVLLLADNFLSLSLLNPTTIGFVSIVVLTNILLGLQAEIDSSPVSRTIGLVLLLDLALLTSLLYVTGGVMNPFSVLYLVHIVIAAVLLGEVWTWVVSGISILSYGVLFLSESDLWIHSHSHGGQSDALAGNLLLHLQGMWGAFSLASVLVAFFVSRILVSLRARDSHAQLLNLAAARGERFASLVNLSAGAAHELSTPLSTIAVVIRDLEQESISAPAVVVKRADVKLLLSEIERCKSILDQMRGQADCATLERVTAVSLADVKSDILAQLPESMRSRVEFVDDDTVMASGELGRSLRLPRFGFGRAVASLVKNAVEAGECSGRRQGLGCEGAGLKVRVVIGVCDGLLRCSVVDSGPGMPKEILDRIGEPFVTTKTSGRGMGLGLFLVRLFCERQGGALEIRSTSGVGTEISVCLQA